MPIDKARKIAVVGAGMAGAACACDLMLAGHSVHVFDKARGPGGRLATRYVEWVDRHGQDCTTRFDHGAVGITAHSPAFRNFVDQALRAGWLARWTPTLAADSLPIEDDGELHVPVPDMPALCRRLLGETPVTGSFAVDSLHKSPFGWQVEAGGERHPAQFDVVVLALPPAQAAPLLGPHRRDWSRQASIVPMRPCWTLIGIADAPQPEPDWHLDRPPTGPLAWVLRNDARPGRDRVPGQAHWLAHARPGWSRRHLEQPAAWVRQRFQEALAERLGGPVDWHHCEVHRWRYALPPAPRVASARPCWWDADLGLGVCGDFLGGIGVEGAWLSARSLSTTLLRSVSAVADVQTAFPAQDIADHAGRRLVA